MRTLGVIGVGSMGAPMARNLIAAGYSVSVCDIREAALEPFQAQGVAATA